MSYPSPGVSNYCVNAAPMPGATCTTSMYTPALPEPTRAPPHVRLPPWQPPQPVALRAPLALYPPATLPMYPPNPAPLRLLPPAQSQTVVMVSIKQYCKVVDYLRGVLISGLTQIRDVPNEIIGDMLNITEITELVPFAYGIAASDITKVVDALQKVMRHHKCARCTRTITAILTLFDIQTFGVLPDVAFNLAREFFTVRLSTKTTMFSLMCQRYIAKHSSTFGAKTSRPSRD